MAAYTEKYVLMSPRYGGFTTYHDTEQEAKDRYDVLMGEQWHIDWDAEDTTYILFQATIITPEGQ
jgi:hypothetical protein